MDKYDIVHIYPKIEIIKRNTHNTYISENINNKKEY